jgi:arginine utilization protein RocB
MKNLYEICAFPASATATESAHCQKLREMLIAHPYFAQHPSQIDSFPMKRSQKAVTYLFALMR